jgi:hypothetical protein
MSNPSRLPQDTTEPPAVTASHMADAVSFLMRVAAEAGLRNIAVKLAGVRASLLTLALAPADAGSPGEHHAGEPEIAGGHHERQKPH